MDRELRVHDADHAQGPGHGGDLFLERLLLPGAQREGRQAATGIAGVDPRLFHVLHDAADDDLLAVAYRIHVHLHSQVQKSVQEHGTLVGHADRLSHVLPEIVLLVDYLHGPATQHVGRPHHQRIPHFPGHPDRLFGGPRRAVRRLFQAKALDELLEPLPVLGQVDGIGTRSDDRHARRLQRPGQLERRLAAVLHDHPQRLLPVHDGQHVFQGERFEVQAVGGVEIRGYRLGIAVHHDGFEPGFLECEGGVNAAVVELDPLPDAVRPPAQDHDLPRVGGIRLAFVLVGGVQVGRVAHEFRRAGVHTLEYRL